MAHHTRGPQDLVSQNVIWTNLIRKENAACPTPVFFAEQPQTLSDSITEKVTDIDPRNLTETAQTRDLTSLQHARFLQIRRDLAASKQTLPVQQYAIAKTRSMSYGFQISDPSTNTLSIRRNQIRYSRPRKGTEITAFATSYAKVNGVSPFQRDRHTQKDHL